MICLLIAVSGTTQEQLSTSLYFLLTQKQDKYDRIILVYAFILLYIDILIVVLNKCQANVTIVLIIIFSEVLEHIGHDFIRKFISCFEFTLADDGFLVFQVMNIFNATLQHIPLFFFFTFFSISLESKSACFPQIQFNRRRKVC